MQIKKIKVENAGNHGQLKLLRVPLLCFRAIVKDAQLHNVEPFTLLVDKRGMIHNYADRVKVSVLNLKTLQLTWDNVSVLSIANTPVVQKEIDSHLGISDSFDKWDAAIEYAEKVNNRAADAVNQIELEMIMDDILKLNIQQAIDHALDRKDEKLFKQLVQMQGGAA